MHGRSVARTARWARSAPLASLTPLCPMMLALAVASSGAHAREVCSIAGQHSDGQLMQEIHLETAADLDHLIDIQAPDAIRDWSKDVASVLVGALSNFRDSVKDAPQAKEVDASRVFAKTLASWMLGKARSEAQSFSSAQMGAILPGTQHLPGIGFILDFHNNLEAEIAAARQARSKLALIDWIVDLNTNIVDSYGNPPSSGEISIRLRRDLAQKAGEPRGRLTPDQLAWGAELCASTLDLVVRNTVLPSTEVAETRLYESWLNAQTTKRDPGCIRLHYRVEGAEAEQLAGSVNDPHFGPQILRRLDQLIQKDVIGAVVDIDVPLCICLENIPDRVFEKPDCAHYDRPRADGTRRRQSRPAHRFAEIALDGGFWKETVFIDPYE